MQLSLLTAVLQSPVRKNVLPAAAPLTAGSSLQDLKNRKSDLAECKGMTTDPGQIDQEVIQNLDGLKLM